MNDEKRQFLSLRHLPSRLNQEETGWLLGFTTREIPPLTTARLLKPLGNPNRYNHKFYATVELQRLAKDVRWLNKATVIVFKFWQNTNDHKERKRQPPE